MSFARPKSAVPRLGPPPRMSIVASSGRLAASCSATGALSSTVSAVASAIPAVSQGQPLRDCPSASSFARQASAYSAPSEAMYEIVPGPNPGSS